MLSAQSHMTNPTKIWNNLLIDTFDSGLMLCYILMWHSICDLWSCSLSPSCNCWAKLARIPWVQADILQQVKHRNCQQLLPQSQICPSLRPKIQPQQLNLSPHYCHKTSGKYNCSIHSPLLCQACTQTSEMGDKMESGAFIFCVRNMNRQLKFSSATAKIINKRLNCRQPEHARASLAVWTCCLKSSVVHFSHIQSQIYHPLLDCNWTSSGYCLIQLGTSL